MPTEDGRLVKTSVARVADAIRRRASRSPDRRIEVTGTEIARETGLKPNQVHDAIFVLTKRGIVRKEQSGARYRPMVLRLTQETPFPDADDGASLELHVLVCPSCSHRIDLVEALKVKVELMERVQKQSQLASKFYEILKESRQK